MRPKSLKHNPNSPHPRPTDNLEETRLTSQISIKEFISAIKKLRADEPSSQTGVWYQQKESLKGSRLQEKAAAIRRVVPWETLASALWPAGKARR